jgi:hypothetical protein
LNNNKTIAVFAIVAALGMLTRSTIQRAMGTNITTTTTTTTLPLTLGNPYYVEYDKTTSQKAVVVNGTTHATEIKFSGHGTSSITKGVLGRSCMGWFNLKPGPIRQTYR